MADTWQKRKTDELQGLMKAGMGQTTTQQIPSLAQSQQPSGGGYGLSQVQMWDNQRNQEIAANEARRAANSERARREYGRAGELGADIRGAFGTVGDNMRLFWGPKIDTGIAFFKGLGGGEQETAQPQTPAAPTQRATGGGQAIAAENPAQPGRPANRQQPAAGGVENYTAGGLNFARSKNENGETVLAATDGSGGTARAVIHGRPQTQGQAQPGLGLRDLGNGQAATNQYGGAGGYRQIQPGYYGVRGNNGGGYVVQGDEQAAKLFGAPVWNSAHKAQNGPNQTFLKYRAEERTRQAANEGRPNWDDYKNRTWQTALKTYQADMDAWDKQRGRAMGYDPEMAKIALQREQMNQQYGLNMANLANSNAQAQAALGLNALQQQQTMQQIEQNRNLENARQTYATARPGSQEWIRARNTIQAYGQGGEKEQKPFEIGEDVDPETGSKTKRYGIQTEDGIMPLQVTGAGGKGGDIASMYANEKDWLDSEQIKKLNGIKDQKQREQLKQALFLRHYGIG